ncbi:hypothetical protein XBP1_1910007 [Xenorhabdus bovienii str. puntauvense]|uniref:Uncharacterized protein n=1 Tax=Xenorhabdus bovienii str. puntauvense TaxID=1398201 RepID=A0A077N1Z5_XENBV|nr:hypothetical protein XBFFR1_270008 [Xenorhabdus bovienii str. feltiae France]CDG91255.1 hypothetical protein XBFFL1_1430001 [Xenorhabdus bovienii str. feltiae Florida]CDG96136.1 hypothetical protein XBP1_1910007 [Xenorhabdus bovienii str. puntauvense]
MISLFLNEAEVNYENLFIMLENVSDRNGIYIQLVKKTLPK